MPDRPAHAAKDRPDAHAPTALASGDPVSREATARKGATLKGRPGATPRHEREPASPEGTPQGESAGGPAAAYEGSLPLGTIVGDRYKLVAQVGAGGQGEVWRAEDVVIAGHVVALKMLFDRAGSEADRDLLLRELRMLASVSHPSVVQFKDHGWLGGRLWFVMPWYEGSDLERAMPLERAEARRIFEQVAAGLAAVHAKGLRHQDLKPSNIFLAKIAGLEETLPILLDFGVAAAEDEVLVAGSPQYFAPELAASWPTPSADVGPAADVFSLALSLRLVLDPDGVPEVGAFDRPSLERRATELITPPSGPGLAFLAPHFERWLALDPTKRPTAMEFGRELAALTQPEERREERLRTLRRAAPWAAAGALLAALGGWWGWQQIDEARTAQAVQEKERLEAELNAQVQTERAQQLGSELDEARALADQSSQRTSDALGRLDEAQAAIASAAGDAARMRVASERALAEARANAQAQQASLEEAQATMTRLSTDLTQTRRQLEDTRTERDTTGAERDRLRNQLEEQRSQLEAARTERDARAADLERARTELERVRGELTSAASARQSAEAEREGLRASVEAARAETRAAEAEASRLRAQLAAANRATTSPTSGGGGTTTGGGEAPTSAGGSGESEAESGTTRGRRGSGARVSGGATVTPRDDGTTTP